VIVRWFKKCFISNVVNGRENDILWEYEEEVGSGSDEAGNGDSEGGEVGNSDSEGDEVGNCEDSQKNW
jgi:hypothetical protein